MQGCFLKQLFQFFSPLNRHYFIRLCTSICVNFGDIYRYIYKNICFYRQTSCNQDLGYILFHHIELMKFCLHSLSMRVCVYVYIYIYIHIYTYIYTHTQIYFHLDPNNFYQMMDHSFDCIIWTREK